VITVRAKIENSRGTVRESAPKRETEEKHKNMNDRLTHPSFKIPYFTGICARQPFGRSVDRRISVFLVSRDVRSLSIVSVLVLNPIGLYSQDFCLVCFAGLSRRAHFRIAQDLPIDKGGDPFENASNPFPNRSLFDDECFRRRSELRDLRAWGS
jgi:hypothetical protein